MSVWGKIGKILAAPVLLPVKAVKKGAEKTMMAWITTLVRHGATALTGLLVGWGLVPELAQSRFDDALYIVASVLVAGALSRWEKKKSEKTGE